MAKRTTLAVLLEEMRAEKCRLDEVIARLERIDLRSRKPEELSRRGRKFMDRADREEVAQRMRRYWAKRRELAALSSSGEAKPE